MEEINLLFSNNLTVIIAVLALALIVLSVCLCRLRSRLSALQAKYDFFTQGKEANIDTLLTDTLNELHRTRRELQELQTGHDKLHGQVQGCLQTVKLTRYDAFDAMGGEMSYSLLLADAKKNGVILTSIYGRDDSRSYAKDIQNGKSARPLADEEKTLL